MASAVSVNQVVRERKLVWRAMRRQTRAVDTKVELLQRFQDRVYARKRKAPELVDLQRAVTMTRELQTEIDRLAKILAGGFPA